MAAGMTASLSGANLGRIAAGMEQRADLVVRQTVLRLEAEMKRRAPYKSGNLRRSIISRMTGQAEGVVTVGAEYGVYVDQGTRYQRAQPFVAPALAAVRPEFEAAMQTLVQP